MPTKCCPYCSSETAIRTILYGLADKEPDPNVYLIGGCMPSDAQMECIACGWQGSKAQVRKGAS